jgi:hypothetical protein
MLALALLASAALATFTELLVLRLSVSAARVP